MVKSPNLIKFILKVVILENLVYKKIEFGK